MPVIRHLFVGGDLSLVESNSIHPDVLSYITLKHAFFRPAHSAVAEIGGHKAPPGNQQNLLELLLTSTWVSLFDAFGN